MMSQIKMQGAPYQAADVVLVTYVRVTVGRFLSEEEAEKLNAGTNPWDITLTEVRRPITKVHYYPDCGGRKYVFLARSIQATTCLTCLKTRARQLRGWSWNAPMNEEEVSFLKSKLRHRVADFGVVLGELVPIDDMVEYGWCPVCGSEPGQQCSVPDPEHPGRGIEFASRVHARRGSLEAQKESQS